mmetsp:Transcript_8864/g.14752  ORF Transcript_8864/g.14752 Transcript_8864/m.14752 type:complete len:197 (-) Transcript_8864:688-1278(-)
MNDLARLGILVIVVSSEGVFFHQGDSQDILQLDHFMPSWIKSEYFEAFEAYRDGQFWASCYYLFDGATQNDNFDRREDLLNEKFEIAGHCTRFMFKKREQWVINEIAAKAFSMGGIDSLEAATRSDRSAGAVNTLIARLQADKNGPTPEQQATFPLEADFTAVATSTQDLLVLSTEWDNANTSPRLVSAQAIRQAY